MVASDDENDFDMSKGGAPPKHRHIQPLRFPGLRSVNEDGVEMKQYDDVSDEDLDLSEENGSRRFDGSQSAAVERTRAQSVASYGFSATRSVRSRLNRVN